MHKPCILIVEDQDLPRQILHEELERREFEVWSAKDVATARRHGSRLGDSLDVAVLDVRLEDPEAPGITGVDIGAEIRRRQVNWPSEFLIISAYPDIDYYHHALRLGAAAYLLKPQEPEEVIRQIRALALRRTVAREAPEDSEMVRRIAEGSRSRIEAVFRFCHEILCEHLEATLGTTFVLLISDSSGTRSCGGVLHDSDPDPASISFFHMVAGLAFGNASATDPFIVDPQRFPELKSAEERSLLDQFAGTAVISLAETRNFRLLLGILQKDLDSHPLAEDAKPLAARVTRYAQTTVTTQLLGVATIWSELDARHRALLATMSSFCTYVGQEYGAILDRARANHEVIKDAPIVDQLQEFGEDLFNAGYQLADLYEHAFSGESGELVEQTPVEVRKLVIRAWEDLAKSSGLKKELLNINGDCTVQGDSEALYFAIYRLLEWLISRLEEAPRSTRQIRVECIHGKISFEENASQRVPVSLRQELFLPFSEPARLPPHPAEPMRESGRFFPLYLAKNVMELKTGGHFEDRSEELEGTLGHRFVMSFPQTEAAMGSA